MFHALARNCADMMIGASKPTRSRHAWAEVYRSLAHGAAKAACEDRKIVGRFPNEIADFAIFFAEMQSKRHAADYSPEGKFYKSAVKADIERAEKVIKDFGTATAKDRRAFASWVLFRHVTNRNR
ncbi:MAG: hypothetical protein K5878_11745 [Rhizobiaceae bacterium]|nr:hypothetical protein [Rhizobiaceae bacterium]